MAFIVVGPRRTETATRADLHLRPVPGTDAMLYAGLQRESLERDWHDADFCARFVDGLDDLRLAVDPATPGRVAAVTGVPVEQLAAAARAFGTATQGMATSGTGANMGPESNLAEHLLQALNLVCGRFPRAGDRAAGRTLLGGRSRAAPGCARRPGRGRAASGARSAGTGCSTATRCRPASFPTRSCRRGPTASARLWCAGATSCIPDQARTVEALRSLELLVTVDPYPSETARLADYVVAPALGLERADHTRPNESWFSEDFGQWTDRSSPALPGSSRTGSSGSGSARPWA
ncbi:hypothetical protein GCM10027026_19550 [Myroides odoratimimus subsp. xuanwuensis]